MGVFSEPKLPSERTFGLTLLVILMIVGARSLTKHWSWPSRA
jgi:hypothetical protein